MESDVGRSGLVLGLVSSGLGFADGVPLLRCFSSTDLCFRRIDKELEWIIEN